MLLSSLEASYELLPLLQGLQEGFPVCSAMAPSGDASPEDLQKLLKSGTRVPVSIETPEGRLVGVNYYDQPIDEEGYVDLVLQIETGGTLVPGDDPIIALCSCAIYIETVIVLGVQILITVISLCK